MLPADRTRLSLLPLIGVLFSSCDGGSADVAPPEPSSRYDVVLITVDTLRADRLGCYGYDRPTSAALDALAAESMVYERCYSHASSTAPALSALMTGVYPTEAGIQENRHVLPETATTLAEILSAEGYRTGAVVSNFVLRKATRFGQGFDHYDARFPHTEGIRNTKERRAAATASGALAWLATQPDDEPLFLWVHFQDPHGPYTPAARNLEPFTAAVADDEPGLPALETVNGLGGIPNYQVLDDERRPSAYRARYDAEIHAVDERVAQIVDALRRSGRLDRTLLVFTADHGELLGEHDYYFCHGVTLHEELIHVPLLVRFPDGRVGREPEPVAHVDIVPTICDVLDVDVAALTLRGRSLLSDEASVIYAETHPPASFTGRQCAIVEGRHKLAFAEDDAQRRWELFDLQSVGGEDETLPETAAELEALRQRLATLRQSLVPVEPVDVRATREEEAVLEALGYTK